MRSLTPAIPPSRPDRALLVGVDRYLTPEGARNQDLEGAVADALAVKEYLISSLGVPEERIETLLSPLDDAAADAGRPSYGNAHAALARLIDGSVPGEQVLFFWSGHGSNVPTEYPELKGPGGRDAGLVPWDVEELGLCLSDVELYFYVTEAVKRGLHPILWLDACFAPSLALRRTSGARPTTPIRAKFFEPGRRPPAGGDSRAVPREALIERWLVAPARRDFEALGLRIPPETVLLAAGTREQAAHEAAWHGGPVRGAFTHSLLAELPAARGETWLTLVDRVSSRVQALVAGQCPQTEGDFARLVFERRLGSLARGPRLVGPPAGSGRVWVAAGAAQGLESGDLLKVRPRQRDGRGSAMELEVQEVHATGSWASLAGPLPAGSLAGERAELAALAQPLRVRLLPPLEPEEPCLAAGRPGGRGLFALVGGEEPAPFCLLRNEAGEVVIGDQAGTPLAHAGTPLARHEDSAPELARRLSHLARFHRLWSLAVPEDDRGLATDARVSVRHRLEEHWSGAVASGEGPPLLGVQAGDPVELVVERGGTCLQLAVLGLTRRWAVQQVLPAPGARSVMTVGREPLRLPIRLKAESADFPGPEQLLILLTEPTSSPPDYRWLELPALDLALRSTRSVIEPAIRRAAGRGPDTEQGWGLVRVPVEVRG
ncbi:MAG TPA: caspase family protein [Thermoanaerobaculia bacterium]|nr:caspase family protein [Thermoanaerobaculia bacterium]